MEEPALQQEGHDRLRAPWSQRTVTPVEIVAQSRCLSARGAARPALKYSLLPHFCREAHSLKCCSVLSSITIHSWKAQAPFRYHSRPRTGVVPLGVCCTFFFAIMCNALIK